LAEVPQPSSRKLFVKSYDLYIATFRNFKELAFERRKLIGLQEFQGVRISRHTGEARHEDRYKPYALLARSMIFLAQNPDQLLTQYGITETSIQHLQSMTELVMNDIQASQAKHLCLE
jgi:hypothetical protein